MAPTSTSSAARTVREATETTERGDVFKAKASSGEKERRTGVGARSVPRARSRKSGSPSHTTAALGAQSKVLAAHGDPRPPNGRRPGEPSSAARMWDPGNAPAPESPRAMLPRDAP